MHDGLLKPMPGVGSGPSLAESWSMARDMASADFTLRAAKFHNGDPVTAEDVKFSFERYRGGHLGFPIGVGPRVDDIMASAIPGFYMSPYEDLKLKRPRDGKETPCSSIRRSWIRPRCTRC
jgi:ABC-type transport system substrate-binding protein